MCSMCIHNIVAIRALRFVELALRSGSSTMLAHFFAATHCPDSFHLFAHATILRCPHTLKFVFDISCPGPTKPPCGSRAFPVLIVSRFVGGAGWWVRLHSLLKYT